MKKLSFNCGDRVNIMGKLRLESAIVCQHIDTTDEKMKVRIVMEDGKVMNKAVGKLIKR
jgi:hypothetical protein